MKAKPFAILGIVAPLLFWITYVIMANRRQEYSSMTKAVSELGSLDAPNMWWWNIFGYMIPGLFIALFSIGLYKNIAQDKAGRLPLYGLALSGVFMMISGIFPGDFEQKTSSTMILHSVGSFGSYLCFLLAAFTYPRLLKADPYWKNTIWPGLIITLLTILFGNWPFVFPDFPAVGQRIVFMMYFLWIIYYAVLLLNKSLQNKPLNFLKI